MQSIAAQNNINAKITIIVIDSTTEINYLNNYQNRLQIQQKRNMPDCQAMFFFSFKEDT